MPHTGSGTREVGRDVVTGSSVGCMSYEDGASYQGKVKPAISPSPALREREGPAAARPWEGEGRRRHLAFPHPSHPFGMGPFVDPPCGSTPQAGEGLTTVRETRLLAGLGQAGGCAGAAKGAVVLERGDHAARLRDLQRIDLRENIARRLAAVRQDLAPGIDDERMAVGLASARVLAALGGSEDVGARLDGAGAHKGVPMRLPRRLGEGRRNREEAGAGLRQRAVEIGEAQVVADGHAEQPPRGRGEEGTI